MENNGNYLEMEYQFNKHREYRIIRKRIINFFHHGWKFVSQESSRIRKSATLWKPYGVKDK